MHSSGQFMCFNVLINNTMTRFLISSKEMKYRKKYLICNKHKREK